MTENIQEMGGLSEREKQQLEAFYTSDDGKATLAKRLEKAPEEITYQDAEELYKRNPSPLFFAREIKLDEIGKQPEFENIPLSQEELDKRQAA